VIITVFVYPPGGEASRYSAESNLEPQYAQDEAVHHELDPTLLDTAIF